MSARKTLRVVASANPVDAAGRTLASQSRTIKTMSGEIAELKSALEAEHKLAAQRASERMTLEEEYRRYRMDAAARYDALDAKTRADLAELRNTAAELAVRVADLDRDLAEARIANDKLQDDNGRLALDLADAAREVHALQTGDATQEIERLRRALIEKSAEAAYHRRRDERHGAALIALACNLGAAQADLYDRDDTDAAVEGRKDAEAANA